ncbi:MAG: threonine synthase [Acidimicrobiia bacterium]
MQYRSTRGGSSGRGFTDVLIEGLAPDGSLYVPEWLPELSSLPTEFPQAAAAVMRPFLEPDPVADDIEAITTGVYARFRHPDVVPLRSMGAGRHLLELFWGPTLSFKDYALQVVGALFDHVLRRRDERILVLGATSGDTGSAAIEACRGREGIDVVILYPDGAVSDVQRRQMTTVPDTNVHAVAVGGTFDDCQNLVKKAFGAFRDRHPLAAINSINWARIMAQSAYYAFTAGRFGEPVRFVVPTGNFGNVLSGHLARRMGAPIAGLIVANNSNHGLTDLITTGTLEVASVKASLAPAMDIQIPSNLERYLFEASGDDPDQIQELQSHLMATGRIDLSPPIQARLKSDFTAAWRPDADIVETIRHTFEQSGVMLDPHTAVAWSVATERPVEVPTVVVATAHPAKFPEVVEQATGQTPHLPDDVAEALAGPERIARLEPDLEALGRLLDGIRAEGQS